MHKAMEFDARVVSATASLLHTPEGKYRISLFISDTFNVYVAMGQQL